MLRNISRIVEEEDRLLFDADCRNSEDMKKMRSSIDNPCVECSYAAICHLPHCTDCYVTNALPRIFPVAVFAAESPVQPPESEKRRAFHDLQNVSSNHVRHILRTCTSSITLLVTWYYPSFQPRNMQSLRFCSHQVPCRQSNKGQRQCSQCWRRWEQKRRGFNPSLVESNRRFHWTV